MDLLLTRVMFSVFKRKVIPREWTFKGRVEEFWVWYAKEAQRFYEVIEGKRCADLAQEVSVKLDAILPGFAWVFGPGEEGVGHSFTLSAEGNRHKQLLTAYWKCHAPHLPGWTFYDARQPSRSISGQQVHIGDDTFDPIEFWVTPSVNEDHEKVDLRVWHPKFASLSERSRWTILFLFLDELLGEIGTQNWVGSIDLTDARLAEAMPIAELPSYIREIEEETGWKKFGPGKFFTVYQSNDPQDRFYRSDIIVGSTSQMLLQSEYLEAEGHLADPLAGTGADYVYAAFPSEFLPSGEESGARGRMEEALDVALDDEKSGRCLGGAFGRRFAYLDAIIFDGERSIETIQTTLRKLQLPREAVIRYFAKEKRNLSVTLG